MNKESLENRDRKIKAMAREISRDLGRETTWRKEIFGLLAEMNTDQFVLLTAISRMQNELKELKALKSVA
jgi:hypothetical protein